MKSLMKYAIGASVAMAFAVPAQAISVQILEMESWFENPTFERRVFQDGSWVLVECDPSVPSTCAPDDYVRQDYDATAMQSRLRWGDGRTPWSPGTRTPTIADDPDGEFASLQSQYTFQEVEDVLIDGTGDFEFAEFFHLNNAIWSDTAMLVEVDFRLRFDGTISRDGETKPFSVDAVFELLHNESLNPAAECPGGDDAPCGDIVSIAGIILETDVVRFGDLAHTFEIRGFSDGGATPVNSFFTDEALESSVFIFGSIDVQPIPLPAGVWMLLAGVGGLAVAARKKRG